MRAALIAGAWVARRRCSRSRWPALAGAAAAPVTVVERQVVTLEFAAVRSSGSP